MTHTLENKAKFFAQYAFTISRLWHTQMDYQYTNICELLLKKDKVDKIFHGNDSAELTFWKLPLKPLSSITDEDAIEVVEILKKIGVLSSAMREPQKFLIPMKTGKGTIELILPVADYLRSKGYALPYMGLSVEKMVEYGWIKIAE